VGADLVVVVDFQVEEAEEAIGLAEEVVEEEVMVVAEEGETDGKKENCIHKDAEH
jgi:hypothetical protein